MSKNDEDDDEEDYMSDKLLKNMYATRLMRSTNMKIECFSNCSTDTRPGLLSQSQARKHFLDKKQRESNEINKEKHQPLNKLEESKRNEALAKSIIDIDRNNKGLSLMKKMGFEVGMSLGKANQTRDSIKEPISVVLKSNREGLGCEVENKRKLEEYEQRKKRRHELRQSAEKLNAEAFLKNKKFEFEMNRMRKMLYKAQRVCHQFDLGAVIAWSA
jgi:hypothetical protein